MKSPYLFLPGAASKAWASLRLWCANLRDATPDTDVRAKAAVLCTLLDAHQALQRRNPALANDLLVSVDMAREQLVRGGFTPPEFDHNCRAPRAEPRLLPQAAAIDLPS